VRILAGQTTRGFARRAQVLRRQPKAAQDDNSPKNFLCFTQLYSCSQNFNFLIFEIKFLPASD